MLHVLCGFISFLHLDKMSFALYASLFVILVNREFVS